MGVATVIYQRLQIKWRLYLVVKKGDERRGLGGDISLLGEVEEEASAMPPASCPQPGDEKCPGSGVQPWPCWPQDGGSLGLPGLTPLCRCQGQQEVGRHSLHCSRPSWGPGAISCRDVQTSPSPVPQVARYQ